MEIILLPIKERLSENAELATNPELVEVLEMTIQFFARVGYSPPWIGYFATMNGQLVGSAGFKGRPIHGSVEIAYSTNESYRKQGIGSAICHALVELATTTDPTVIVTARTFAEENFSTRILRKNGFLKKGTVLDPDDGEVWEWIYTPTVA
ncbi:MAG: GNAT family protein [Chryseolinea sp.]